MILTNSDGNFVEITNSDNYRVDVMVYETEAIHTNGLNPAWQKTMNSSFHCGDDLKTALSVTATDETKTIKEATDEVCMAVIETLAVENADRFRIPYNLNGTTEYIKGDWVVTII